MSRSRWVVPLASVLAVLCACGLSTRIPFSRSPGSSDVLVFVEVTWLGDARVFLRDKDSGRNFSLFNIAFADSNERVMQLEWSPDGSKLGWLIANSDRSPTGRRLLVFDITDFPRSEPKRVVDTTEEVMRFEFLQNGVRYLLWDGREVDVSM
jgi:hypothetical protein